jgi:hypothetical protein
MSEPNASTIRIDTITDQQISDVIAHLWAKIPRRTPITNEVRLGITHTIYSVDVWANNNVVVARDVSNRVRDKLREPTGRR